MAEIRIPVTELTKVWPETEMKTALMDERRANVRQVYYNLYGQLIVSGDQIVLRHDLPWFKVPLSEGMPKWLQHGRVLEDDGVRLTVVD